MHLNWLLTSDEEELMPACLPMNSHVMYLRRICYSIVKIAYIPSSRYKCKHFYYSIHLLSHVCPNVSVQTLLKPIMYMRAYVGCGLDAFILSYSTIFIFLLSYFTIVPLLMVFFVCCLIKEDLLVCEYKSQINVYDLD